MGGAIVMIKINLTVKNNVTALTLVRVEVTIVSVKMNVPARSDCDELNSRSDCDVRFISRG